MLICSCMGTLSLPFVERSCSLCLLLLCRLNGVQAYAASAAVKRRCSHALACTACLRNSCPVLCLPACSTFMHAEFTVPFLLLEAFLVLGLLACDW